MIDCPMKIQGLIIAKVDLKEGGPIRKPDEFVEMVVYTATNIKQHHGQPQIKDIPWPFQG